jgi:poly(3-hydroxybutyrate) depolymerase
MSTGSAGHGGNTAGHGGATAGHGGQSGGSAQGGAATGGGGTGTGGSSAGGSGSVTSPGCGKNPTLKNGTQSITSSGQNRSFMIRVPENYDKDHPYWLIFGFHWVGGTANDVDSGGTSGYTWSYYGLRELADKSTASRAIFVAPQGISNGWGNSNNQDVVLTDDLIKLVEGDLCVDTKHVFSTGFSYGGGMTKALGCQRPNVFRAIAVYSGADFLSGGCDSSSTSPIAYIGLHSINDGTNSYASGEAIRDRFVKNDGCTPQTPAKPPNSTSHVCTTYQGCKAGYPVEWCAFDGGGHSPAPVDGSSNGSGGGDKTWTKAEVWKFFNQF